MWKNSLVSDTGINLATGNSWAVHLEYAELWDDAVCSYNYEFIIWFSWNW